MDIVNSEDIEQLSLIDGLFRTITGLYSHPPNWKRPQGFLSLSKIILEQQVSLASANAHFLKLSNYIIDFTPSKILLLSDEEMRSCHISRQKAKYLRALSSAIVNGDLDLEKLSTLNEPEIRISLKKIKGIGDWTADIYLMFCLQSKDIFPTGDIAAVNTVKELTDSKTKDEILQKSETWKPYRSLATYFLWHYYLSRRNRSDK